MLSAFSVSSAVGAIVQDNRARDQRDAIMQMGDLPPSARAEYNSLVVDRDRFVTGAWVTGGLAVLVGGVGAALYFGDTPSDSGVRLTPMTSAAPNSVGAAVIGRF